MMHADHILVLEDGEMIGYGTHEELMESCEIYQEISRSQTGAEYKSGEEYGADYKPGVEYGVGADYKPGTEYGAGAEHRLGVEYGHGEEGERGGYEKEKGKAGS